MRRRRSRNRTSASSTWSSAKAAPSSSRVNKWDLVEREPGALSRLRDEVDRLLPQIKGVPVVTLSARTGDGLDRLMAAVFESYAVWNRRAVDRGAQPFPRPGGRRRNPPPAVSGRALRLDYITQPKARPPTFVLFSSRARRAAGDLSALPGQWFARKFRAAGHADPADAARQGQSLTPAKSAAAEVLDRAAAVTRAG